MRGRLTAALMTMVMLVPWPAAADPQAAGAAAPASASATANPSTPRALVTIIGRLSYRERIALPPGATLLVTLAEQAGGDPTAPALARQSLNLAGEQVPLSFRLTAAQAKLKAGERYAVRAMIQDKAGQPLWSIQSAHVIDPGQSLHDLGTLWMTRAALPAPTPAPTNLLGPGTLYQCGDTQVTALLGSDSMDLTLDGRTYPLQRRGEGDGSDGHFGGTLDGTSLRFRLRGAGDASLSVNDGPERACTQSSFAEPDKAAHIYEAQGRSPDWSLRIGPQRLDLVRFGTGTSQIAQVPTPERQLLADGYRYVGSLGEGELRVTINPGTCIDERTGTPLPDRVTLEVEGRPMTGCGGAAGDFLAHGGQGGGQGAGQGGEWRIVGLNGDVVADNGLSLRFLTQGRLNGNGGCTRFMASYRASVGSMTINPRNSSSTPPPCPREAAAREQALLSTLRGIIGHRLDPDGTLVLSGLDATEVRLRE